VDTSTATLGEINVISTGAGCADETEGREKSDEIGIDGVESGNDNGGNG
jgi:hypothetical protein